MSIVKKEMKVRVSWNGLVRMEIKYDGLYPYSLWYTSTRSSFPPWCWLVFHQPSSEMQSKVPTFVGRSSETRDQTVDF